MPNFLSNCSAPFIIESPMNVIVSASGVNRRFHRKFSFSAPAGCANAANWLIRAITNAAMTTLRRSMCCFHAQNVVRKKKCDEDLCARGGT